jgi:hypothetical protein
MQWDLVELVDWVASVSRVEDRYRNGSKFEHLTLRSINHSSYSRNTARLKQSFRTPLEKDTTLNSFDNAKRARVAFKRRPTQWAVVVTSMAIVPFVDTFTAKAMTCIGQIIEYSERSSKLTARYMDEIDCIVRLTQTYPTAGFIKLTNLLLALSKVIILRATEPEHSTRSPLLLSNDTECAFAAENLFGKQSAY